MLNSIAIFQPSWFAGIVQRELSKFEKVERQRLSNEVLAGWLSIEDAKVVVELKLKMIAVGAAQQNLARVEELVQKKDLNKLSRDELNELWFLQHNIEYYKNLVLEHQVKLPNLWQGIDSWCSDQLLRKYFAMALKVYNDKNMRNQ